MISSHPLTEEDRDKYSISGKVIVTPSQTQTWFQRRPSAILIHSLVVTFDGQTELIGDRYLALRLCTLSSELVRCGPIQMHLSEEQERLEFTFNICFAGCLPASDQFGFTLDGPTGVQYALFAKAEISPIDTSDPSLLSSIGLAFQRKTSVDAPPCPVIINRLHISPRTCFPTRRIAVGLSKSDDFASTMPRHILKELEIVCEYPEQVSVESASFPLLVQTRTPRLSASEASRFRISQCEVSLHQHEKYGYVL